MLLIHCTLQNLHLFKWQNVCTIVVFSLLFCSVMQIERAKKIIQEAKSERQRRIPGRDKQKHMRSPLQLCLLPNATVARWRCCLSTNQFTIDFFFGFSFLFCSFEKHKKCCNFEKQVPTRALLCAVAFRSVAALQLQLLLLLLFGI